MSTTDLSAAVDAHDRAFTGPAQRRVGMSPEHWPMPLTYDEAMAELQATREELNDVLAEHGNLGPLLRTACEANAAMSREFEHLLSDQDRIRDERDELVVRVDELRDEVEVVTDERNSARDEVVLLKEQLAARPVEPYLGQAVTR
ncbi:hypothetical protein [Mycobacterium sp. DL440]|uniref:hypothetical protein n=1 Tax=Mycobacterium sp. DL440 TaxID=2675523 RepID=UPI00141D764A|nr:hypothetical protein [Mycobacterium sp. DL440]